MTNRTTDAIRGPVRTCIVCRGRFPKKELTRHVWRGDWTPDEAYIQPGRGYYCCAGEACKAKFPKRAAAVRKGKGEGKRDEA
ncbi:YlxR family protein [Fundidesulfovibrio agrisoli]|uniref:YlxR family protein n=1 Tax=Fundidesulfovibrio agrisoli TaxID=2922717 RepID=UPI001FAC45F4|nr:YlxR family protein [Fundidesulfovibrio agrisoli]